MKWFDIVCTVCDVCTLGNNFWAALTAYKDFFVPKKRMCIWQLLWVAFRISSTQRLPVFLWKTTCFSEQILQFADNLIGKVRLSLCMFELASVPNQIQWEKCQLQLEEGNANLPSGLLAICLIPLCKIICCKRHRSARMKPHWLLLEL